MSKIILLLVLVSAVLGNLHLNIKYRDFLNGQSTLDLLKAKQIYSQYKSSFKGYSEYRFKIFMDTLSQIRKHNQQKHSWTKGINDFSDMTFAEFKASRLMVPQNCSATNRFEVQKEVQARGIPDGYEWKDYGIVTPVKNQGSCGSCWAFSTVGSMQSHWNLLGKGQDITFSEQQLVDCAGDFNNYGCDGGLPSQAFEYIKHAGGLESDSTYPYTAITGNQCFFREEIAIGFVKEGSFNITQGDEEQLAERLYNAGPISVSFEVVDGFRDYFSGVYKVENCGTSNFDVNHAVLATGYGIEEGVTFWNIKNSWGASWGNQGYFKMERGTNMCAISQCNSYPLIDMDDQTIKLKQ